MEGSGDGEAGGRPPDEQPLTGGVANAGAVVRSGAHVLRPSNPHTGSVHAFLRALRAAGFEGASEPIGVDPDGRERLVFIDGDVPVPPYPDWARTDGALVSVAELMADMHRAAASFDPAGLDWSDEMADPVGGPIVCHNEVCLENVVFRDGRAVGLLDFDFCAPGRPVRDLASFARMCVPVDDDANADRLGWSRADRPARLRAVADAYGLAADGRAELLACLDHDIAHGGEFVLRHVEAGEPGFVAMWEEMGGMARFDRRREWWASARPAFAAALA
ncbi:phosphotransferase [Dermatobacter hominis]|uniref:phosphotransferase n=1 Tax=Dermatobacter hominis TaxID=2884263 RepID=UPI001D11F87E|nr:phosphotransferase [Dermatobacter hominis]UDY35892.1 phosphotransferase [Dermatobacter hominis]